MESEIIKALSRERLETYRQSPTDSIDTLVQRYLYNIELSQFLYPALSLLEVTLRNHLNTAIDNFIRPNWLLDEAKTTTPSILLPFEHGLLMQAYQNLSKPYYNKAGTLIQRTITAGKLIAELNFGFWVNLCNDKYNPTIWMKKPTIFDEVFPYFDSFMTKNSPNAKRHKRLNKVTSKLVPILRLRNRVFHHEPVFNHPSGLEKCYADIEELLFYLSLESSQYLIEISKFNECCKKPHKAKT